MDIRKLNERFTKLNENVDPQLAKQIFDYAGIDYEIEEDENIKEYTYRVNDETIHYYTPIYESLSIMTQEDYEKLCSEIASEVWSCFPDGLDEILCSSSYDLMQSLLADNFVLNQAIDFVNTHKDTSYDLVELEHSDIVINDVKYIIINVK